MSSPNPTSQTPSEEMVRVEPMPSRGRVVQAGLGKRILEVKRARWTVAACAAGIGAAFLWWRLPGTQAERMSYSIAMQEVYDRRHGFHGVVDLEIYDELETIGKYQRLKRRRGERIPPVNEAARELGFDVNRYPWNYDRRPPPRVWYSPRYQWYKFERKYFYTPDEIEDIDRLYP
eukprot:Sspe_Gene.109743::Locus_89909_Transcript_1_3_Confidence_0.500_Length_807::g.109743::m.109743